MGTKNYKLNDANSALFLPETKLNINALQIEEVVGLKTWFTDVVKGAFPKLPSSNSIRK